MKIMRMFKIKGQSTAEYAIIIGVIVAMVIAMQTYVKRGMQGRVKDVSDKFYDTVAENPNWASDSIKVDPLKSKQYEPEGLSSKSTQNVIGDWQESTIDKEGKVKRESDRTTKQAVGDYQTQEYEE